MGSIWRTPFLNPVFKTVVHPDLMLLQQPPQTGESAIFFELFTLTRDRGARELLTTEF